jgi:uncharacterized membrane protein YciS (DUF1049 family)
LTTLTERLPVDEITARAHAVNFGRVLLTTIAAIFFAIGWLVGRVFFAVAWCAVAVKVGFVQGRAHGTPGPG